MLDANEQFAHQLTRHLKRRGWSKAELARRMGVARSVASNLCGNNLRQHGLTLLSIAKAARALRRKVTITIR